jgi:hypothetical protein
MSQSRFPKGWDDKKVGRVLARYVNQTEEDAAVEDQAGVRSSETVTSIPRELVSEVRALIAKRQRER